MGNPEAITPKKFSGDEVLELKVFVVAYSMRTSAVPHPADIPRKTVLWHPGTVRVRSARRLACGPARPGVPQTPVRREGGRSSPQNRAHKRDRPAARSPRLRSSPGPEGSW